MPLFFKKKRRPMAQTVPQATFADGSTLIEVAMTICAAPDLIAALAELLLDRIEAAA